MPPDDGIIDNTEEELGTVIYRLEDTLKETLDIVRPLVAGVSGLADKVAHLELIAAAKEIPATVTEVSKQAGTAVGSAGETAGAAIGTVPAVATDVLEDVEQVGNTTGKAVERAQASVWKHRIKR
jgi:uncharacterized protein YgbK (DUF1537 family)